ncbi:MAG: DUF1887 family protein [Epsilonproteobacteria bacterium]|nr:DUF1887 family protein [Campylobacterota bacterium]
MTLVSIVGDFHSSILPLFYHFKDRLRNHVIVYDDYKRDVMQAHKIINGTQAFIQKSGLNIKNHSIEIDEDNYDNIAKLIEVLRGITPRCEDMLINVTDGPANVALLLSEGLMREGARFVTYDRYDNTYNMVSKGGMQSKNPTKTIPIEDHFMLKNIRVMHKQERSLADAIEHELVDYFENYHGERALFLSAHPDTHEHIKSTANGFLFELYVYNLLKRLNHDDICVGVKVSDIYSQDIAIENEFDLLIMKENHLHMIECKFQSAIKKVELIYKVDSVRSSLDDESIIIILSDEALYDAQSDTHAKSTLPIYKRSNAKRIYFRGSPIGRVERFIKEVDELLMLQTSDLDEIVAKRIKPHAIEEMTKEMKMREIANFIERVIALGVDYFNKKEILKILNHKVCYRENKRVRLAMEREEFRVLMRFINKMHRGKQRLDMDFIYNYYRQKFMENRVHEDRRHESERRLIQE